MHIAAEDRAGLDWLLRHWARPAFASERLSSQWVSSNLTDRPVHVTVRVSWPHSPQRAYDNPKFVEDIVRDVAVRLDREERVRAYVIEAANFKSIHNHSAYALIERDKETPGV